MKNTNLLAAESHRRSAISLTPLIDVVFILLLFFMLSSTFSPLSALSVTASSSGSAESQAEVKPLIIHIVDAKVLRISGASYHYAENGDIPPLQRAIIDKAPVMVRAEPTASVQHVVDILAFLEQQGLSNLHLGKSTGASDAQ